MPKISRFLLKESDRSGFKQFRIDLIKDGPWLVHPDEFDQPPPSRLPLGGEGEIATGDLRSNSDLAKVASTDTAAGLGNPVVYLTAAGGIQPSFVHPWMYVSGSNGAVTITANPQIVAGRQGQVLTLYCVDSAITLTHGTGINLIGSVGSVTIRSGGVITLYYTSGGTVWNETARNYL